MYFRNKRVKWKVLVGAFALMIGAAPGFAQTTAEKIRAINEEIGLLNAKLQKLDLEAKIATKETEKVRLEQSIVGSNQAADRPSAADVELPVVKAIEGIDGKLVAKLGMRGGVEQTVSVGEKFGVWTTKELSVNAVTFVRGKETVRVPFGNQPSSEYQSGQRGGTTNSPVDGSPFPIAQPSPRSNPNL